MTMTNTFFLLRFIFYALGCINYYPTNGHTVIKEILLLSPFNNNNCGLKIFHPDYKLSAQKYDNYNIPILMKI